jgi:hypothetical protein
MRGRWACQSLVLGKIKASLKEITCAATWRIAFSNEQRCFPAFRLTSRPMIFFALISLLPVCYA